MKRIVGLYISWLITIVMLGLAVLRPMQIRDSYARGRSRYYNRAAHTAFGTDFYTLLRWVACIVFVYSAVTAFRSKRVAWTWIFGILGALFNPVAPVHLQRNTWHVIDCLAIGVIIAAAVVFWPKKGEREISQSPNDKRLTKRERREHQ